VPTLSDVHGTGRPGFDDEKMVTEDNVVQTGSGEMAQVISVKCEAHTIGSIEYSPQHVLMATPPGILRLCARGISRRNVTQAQSRASGAQT